MKYKLQKLILIFVCLCAAIILLPVTIIVAVGMLPTLVSFFVDKTRGKAQTISVGAFNFAACFLFLVRLLSAGSLLDEALSIVTDPVAIIVIYMGAGAGYLVDIVVSSVAVGLAYKKIESRQVTIKKIQRDLVERWGKEVSGG
jgi:uncharacterized SAM-binding protein YcdF (DUF218 family)